MNFREELRRIARLEDVALGQPRGVVVLKRRISREDDDGDTRRMTRNALKQLKPTLRPQSNIEDDEIEWFSLQKS